MDAETSSARQEGWQSKARRKVDPLRVFAFDQIDLPLPMPSLELLFACDGGQHVLEKFIPSQQMDAILRSEALNLACAMLIETRKQIGSDANVQRPVGFAGEDVDAGLLHWRPACGEMDAETSSA